jgi:hypothetical protein
VNTCRHAAVYCRRAAASTLATAQLGVTLQAERPGRSGWPGPRGVGIKCVRNHGILSKLRVGTCKQLQVKAESQSWLRWHLTV